MAGDGGAKFSSLNVAGLLVDKTAFNKFACVGGVTAGAANRT